MARQTEAHLKVKKLPSLWHEIKKNWVAYIYISPFYILFAIFGAFPILFSFYLSFYRWRGYGHMVFRGFKNYSRLLHDSLFWTSLWNTVVIWIAAHVPMLLLALVLAFILNSGLVKFRRLFEAIYFTPVVTSSVAVSFVFMTMYGVRFGLINFLLKSFGLPAIDWWGGTGFWIKPAIIFLFVWRWTGWNMVIYLAGLQGIDPEFYDAANVDGAGYHQIFLSVALSSIYYFLEVSHVLAVSKLKDRQQSNIATCPGT